VLLHSADISNPAKVWRIAKSWGDRIQMENFAQGDMEKAKNLTVSPFMDRNQENQPQTSINFIGTHARSSGTATSNTSYTAVYNSALAHREFPYCYVAACVYRFHRFSAACGASSRFPVAGRIGRGQ